MERNAELLLGCLRPLARMEFEHLVSLGWFSNERVELLRGVLVRMSPQGPLHAEVIHRLIEVLIARVRGRARVRAQSPFALADDSQPEPDVALVPVADYALDHPGRALLVIEVAASSLAMDIDVKAPLYAEHGVPEYWVVNLAARQIDVHTDPDAGTYQTIHHRRPGSHIELSQLPGVAIAVEDIL